MPNDIEVMRADPELDSQDIVRLIDICREERRTVLDHYTVEEERIHRKSKSKRSCFCGPNRQDNIRRLCSCSSTLDLQQTAYALRRGGHVGDA